MTALWGVDPGLSATATQLDECTAQVTVTTHRVALAVHFDIPGFVAADEFFHMAPASQARVVLRSPKPAELHGRVSALNSRAPSTILCSGATSR